MGIKGINAGVNNGMWKGDNVGYISLHEWIRNRKPKPDLCEECKSKPPHDVANISGEYKRDVNDYEWLCRSCHMKKDGRMDRLHPNKWNAKEIDMLNGLYPDHTQEQISVMMNKSVKAVNMKAHRLGLRKERNHFGKRNPNYKHGRHVGGV